jgi:hypothetical protein
MQRTLELVLVATVLMPAGLAAEPVSWQQAKRFELAQVISQNVSAHDIERLADYSEFTYWIAGDRVTIAAGVDGGYFTEQVTLRVADFRAAGFFVEANSRDRDYLVYGQARAALIWGSTFPGRPTRAGIADGDLKAAFRQIIAR